MLHGLCSLNRNGRICKDLGLAHALIVKLIGKSLPYNFFIERLRLHWGIQGDLDVVDIENGFFMVKISSKDDRVLMLTKGLWVIVGYYLSVQS